MRPEVQQPGKRGGKYYFDAQGRIQYGTQPTPKKRAARRPEVLKQRKTERKQERKAQTRLTPAHHKAAKAFRADYPRLRERVLAHVSKFLRDATVKVFHAALKVSKTWIAFEHHVKKLHLDPEHVVLHALVHVPHLIDLVSATAAMVEPLLRSQEPESRQGVGIVVGLDLLERDYPAHRLNLIRALEMSQGGEDFTFSKAVRMCSTWEELDRVTGGAMWAVQQVFVEHPAALDAIVKSNVGRGRYVTAPGSRGGRYHWTQTGNVRYGKEPEGFRAHLEHIREREAARKTHIEAIAAAAVATGGVVKLHGDRWAILTRNTHPNDKPFRATLFDSRGVYSHDVGDSPTEALSEATQTGEWQEFRASTPAEFEEFASRPSFIEGNRTVILLQNINRLSHEAAKRKDKQLASDARELSAMPLDEAEVRARVLLAQLRTLVQKALYALPWIKARTLAPGQINLFGGRQVQHPGIRGGDYWYDENGQVRYGPRPKPEPIKQPEPIAAVPIPAMPEAEPTMEGALAELGQLEEERKAVPHTPLERLQAVMRRFNMGVKMGTTGRGNSCLNIYSTKRVSREVFDARNMLFQALKAERVVWGWKDGAEFYWSCWLDKVDRVIEIFGGEHGGESIGAVTQPAGPAVRGPEVDPVGYQLPGGGDAGVGPGPRGDTGGSLPEGAGPVPSGEDRAGGDVAASRAVSAAIPDEGPNDRLIAELAAIQPPEPTLTFPMPLLDQLATLDASITPANQKDVCRIVESYQRGDRAYLAGNGTGTGKAQPLDAGLLTPIGWKRMGEIRVGDEVIAVDGLPARVVGVYPQGVKPVFRVLFSDGASTECCDEHLWETQTLYARRKASENTAWNCAQSKVLHLSEIRGTLGDRHFVPIVSPIQFAPVSLPLDAYVVGVLIGDGNFTHKSVTISTQDVEIVERVERSLPFGVLCARMRVWGDRCSAWRLTDIEGRRTANGGFVPGRIGAILETLELRGLSSERKFIPERYLRASIEDRVALLQGLMDTDGYAEHRSNAAYFTTVSAQLADDVVELVRGLGGIASVSRKVPRYRYDGEERIGRLAHTVCVRVPNEIQPFGLKRKQLSPRSFGLPKRAIVDVEAVGEKETQCIAIDHPRQLYVTDDYVVTHNTFLGLGALWMTRPESALIVVPNQGVADQWKEDGKKFGLEIQDALGQKGPFRGISVVTYAGMRTGRVPTNGWGMAIFDEVHREATKLFEGRQTAKMVNRVATAAKFTVFASATPFERPQECSYLFDLLLFDDEGFQPWSVKHGVQWQTRKVYTKGGGSVDVQVPKFVGSSKEKYAKVVDMLRIRADIVGQGRGVFREIEVTEPLNINFEHQPVVGEHADTVKRAIDAMQTFLPDEPVFKMQKINMAKRLLDYVKIEKAVDLAERAVREGKRVALFISNVSPFKFDKISDEELRMVDENGKPLVPYVRRMIQECWNAAGLSKDVKQLPSPTEELMRRLRARLGEKKVSDYTGKVTEGRRKKIKAQFQKGDLPVIVATIAAGGTGLSLHDTRGDAPRYQINVGLPWTGKELQQMIGRTYRVGVKSPVQQVFLLTPHSYEQHVGRIVAGKLQSMRAGVNGITADTNVAHLEEFTLAASPDEVDENDESDESVPSWMKAVQPALFEVPKLDTDAFGYFLYAVAGRGDARGRKGQGKMKLVADYSPEFLKNW